MSMMEVIAYYENLLARLQYLQRHGMEAEGVVLTSQAIYDRAESEDGFAITFQYTTQDGLAHTVEKTSTIHFPSRKIWNAYVNANQVGARIKVIYDPEARVEPLFLFADDPQSLDAIIATNQKELQRIQGLMRARSGGEENR